MKTTRRYCCAAVAALAALLACAPAAAAEPLREFDGPAERERYNALLAELRCLVCQNQSLESSDAELAQDLRNEVYRLVVVEDRSREAAVEFLTQRYGDFVLYRPPVQPSTWLLWFGPLLLLAAGAGIAAVVVRQRVQARPLSAAEHERARQLLDGAGSDSPDDDRESR